MTDILITGGTGSFGQELTSKLLENNRFTRICIYSRDEHKQEKMFERFKNHLNKDKLRFFIGDVRDLKRLQLAMNRCEIIVHAAALKIVPTAEYNPFEAVKTNILGTQNLIDAALWNAEVVKQLILLSTDKCVHPINLYGATKLCAERMWTAANHVHGAAGPRFFVVRYGNVAASNGSVAPIFAAQAQVGIPLTVTHPEMTRFWITLEESVNFVLHVLNLAYGGEIFVPKMPSFKIKDMAESFWDMYNYKLEDRWLNIIGKRRGEKLHELVITKEELESAVVQEKFYVLNPAQWEIDHTASETLLNEVVASNSDFVTKLNIEDLKVKLGRLGYGKAA